MNGKKIIVLSNGGTISCMAETAVDEIYHSPTIKIDTLIEKIPFSAELKQNIICEQAEYKISQHVNAKELLALAKKIQHYSDDESVKGIVIVQGTNCLEEIAYFINLVVNTTKPIVFTGAFYPANSLGSDGLLNLYNAIQAADSEQTKKHGAVLAFNGTLVNARDAGKINPSTIHNFAGNEHAVIGYVQGGITTILKSTSKKHTYLSEFNIDKLNYLPSVCIIYGHLLMDKFLIEAAIVNKIAAIILAGVGKGYASAPALEALGSAVRQGIPVVRVSRSSQGLIQNDHFIDSQFNFIAGHTHSPQKAAILLALALTKTKDLNEIQRLFLEY